MALNRPKTLWRKTILIFLAGGVLICLLFSVIYVRVTGILREETNQLFENNVYHVSERCRQEAGRMEDLVLGIAENQWIKNYLSDLQAGTSTYMLTKVRIMREVLRERNLTMADNVYVYLREFDPVNCFYSVPVFETGEKYRRLLETERGKSVGGIRWQVVQTEPYVLEAVAYIHSGERVHGLLVVQFTDKELGHILAAGGQSEQGAMALTQADGTVLYAREAGLVNRRFLQAQGAADDYVVTYPLGLFGWSLTGVLDSEAVTRNLREIIPMLIGVLLCILLLVAVIAAVIVRSFLLPINQILYGMNRVRKGDLAYTIPRGRQDEFGVIADDFNDMVRRVGTLLQANRQQRDNYYRLEMLALKSKLNPHFLYNAFDLIYWRLVLKNDYETADIVVTLADILRYSVNHKKEYVTVREDMRYMESYLSLQQLLQNGRMEYRIEAPQELLDCEMPKLLLQPLVENAIKYGLNGRTGKLRLALRREGRFLLFTVQDDGRGIAPEVFQALLREPEGKGGFGIRLVRAMVRSTYGEACGLEIHSAPGQGTTIEVRILDEVPQAIRAAHESLETGRAQAEGKQEREANDGSGTASAKTSSLTRR